MGAHMNRRHRLLSRLGLLLALMGVAACASLGPQPPIAARQASGPAIRPAECFPVESLTAADRREADRLLLTLGDSEGLYTLAGGLKPISSGMQLPVPVAPELDRAALALLEQRRRVTASLTCGDIGMFVRVFTAVQESDKGATARITDVVLYHRASLATSFESRRGRSSRRPTMDPGR
jgi:hypothetical protein